MASSHGAVPQRTIVHRGEAAIRRLGEFGLTPEALMFAAREAEIARNACTAHHVPTHPGSRAWAEGNRALADRLVPIGFTYKVESNVPLLFHATDPIAITMSAGDKFTGTDGTPSTKNDRGPASSRMIEVGLDLFAGTPFEPKVRSGLYDLWYLLWYRFGDVIRCELSQPRHVVGGDVTD